MLIRCSFFNKSTRFFQQSYNRDDCSFKEQILPDGYNVYTSDKHRVLLSLGNQRQRLQGRDRGVPALAQFLPRINTVPEALISGLGVPEQPRPGAAQTEENMDNVDSFGKLSQIIHSPSFHERWRSHNRRNSEKRTLSSAVWLHLSHPAGAAQNQGRHLRSSQRLLKMLLLRHPVGTVLSTMTATSCSLRLSFYTRFVHLESPTNEQQRAVGGDILPYVVKLTKKASKGHTLS